MHSIRISGTIVVIIAMVIMTASLSLAGHTRVEPMIDRAPYLPHAPIHIYNNFSQKASEEGWPGAGTENDPYRIEDLDIDATGSSFGIFIGGTEEHFVILDCHVHNADTETSPQYKGNGIYLVGVSNGIIRDNMIYDNEYQNIMLNTCLNVTIYRNAISDSNMSSGVQAFRCSDIRIEENLMVSNHGSGLELSFGSRVIAEGNTIMINKGNGILVTNMEECSFKHNVVQNNTNDALAVLGYCPDNIFMGNQMIAGGIGFYDEQGSIMEQTITKNNTVNGDPIYYYSSSSTHGNRVPANAGEVILAGVTGISLSSIEFEGGTVAVIAGYCDGLSITNCTVNAHDNGMVLFGTSNSTILWNGFNGIQETAISMEGGRGNVITGNDIAGDRGIYLFGSSMDNTISWNRMVGCWDGISLVTTMSDISKGMNNTVACNEIIDFENRGIYAQMEEMSRITNNTISTGSTGIELFNTKNITVSGNLIEGSQLAISVNGRYWGGSWHNTVTDNRIEDTNGTGIELNRSMGGHYSRNLIYNSTGFGIWVGESHSNVLAGNDMLKNRGSDDVYSPSRIQARDGSVNNRWDIDGKGNYWSDHLTPDDDLDGIVDDPYLIFGGESFDSYPLCVPPVVFLSGPINLMAVPGNGMVTLTWSPPEFNMDTEVEGYIVFKREGDRPLVETFLVEDKDTILLDLDVENNVEYHYRVAGLNRYGTGLSSAEVSVTPDGTPPVVEITSPVNGYITNSTELMFSWNGTDDVSLDHFEYQLDDRDPVNAGNADNVSIGPIDEGYHVFHLVGVDIAGNRNGTSITFIIDLTPPQVEITNDPEDLITRGTTFMLMWMGVDDNDIARYDVRMDEGEWVDVDTSLGFLFEGLSEGPHEVMVMATDLAGNHDTAMEKIFVDLTPPDVHILWPVDDLQTLDRDINVRWFTVETAPGTPTHWISVDGSDWVLVGPGSFFNITGLEVGNHTVAVRAVDEAGNIGEVSVAFHIYSEEIPPEKVRISGKVVDKEDNGISGVKVGSDDGATTETDSNGNFIIMVDKGPRMLTFSKDGYEDLTWSVEANDNITIPSGGLVMEEEEEDDPFNGLKVGCYLCCGVPMVLLLVLMIIGLIARSNRRKDRTGHTEE
ncbi:MAG: right-handed parallel beta-helix repeat-containing protein [Candidatus Thermoplasmatota archaeon]|nr:right-handed parallel beta-helix repeat-containing protein [Candidatus Thermoplasmatota archaeon]